MASPASFEVTRCFGVGVHNSKFKFGKLYLHQVFSGPNVNQSDVIEANTETGLGQSTVNDWAIYDGPGSQATLVARGQGMHTMAANQQNWLTIVFQGQRFNRSTLHIMGASLLWQPNDWAIVGGTGDFGMASGVIQRTIYEDAADEKIYEITIDGYCRMNLPPVPTPTLLGVWGEQGLRHHFMTEKSRRLDSFTIRHLTTVETIEFSYFNEAEKLHTDRFGSAYDNGRYQITIYLGPSEVVTGITGIAGAGGISKLMITTNARICGPFGAQTDGPPFSFNVPADKTVVGFLATGTVDYVSSIGLYAI